MYNTNLFEKYESQAPRYTSYPTVPFWKTAPTQNQWIQHIHNSLRSETSTWSMYVHIPFCETLCWYCGCNTITTKNHKGEESYIHYLLKEWALYKNLVPPFFNRNLENLHLGGGTPTFLSEQNIDILCSELLKNLKIDSKNFEGSVEVDPRRTRVEQLKVLAQFGFNRISLGVQDFDPIVQKAIHRVQSFEETEKITLEARALGYKSVNFDLVCGLPHQTTHSIQFTAEQVLRLQPDRIALYSFAYVPWMKPGQKLIPESSLPDSNTRRILYETARELLLSNGYVEIGMDHFAKPTDDLAKSLETKKIHRNFMGYTTVRTDVLLGLGVSSISETVDSFHQNEKDLRAYEQKLDQNQIPTYRGHVLTGIEKKRRDQILKLMTQFKVEVEDLVSEKPESYFSDMVTDDLVLIRDNRIEITDKGRPFLRNICMFFDDYLRNKALESNKFSKV